MLPFYERKEASTNMIKQIFATLSVGSGIRQLAQNQVKSWDEISDNAA
jgi:hypothetical protein